MSVSKMNLDVAQSSAFYSEQGAYCSGPSTLRQISLDGIAILVEKFIEEFEAGNMEKNLRTQVVYSVCVHSGLGVFNENSWASLRNLMCFLNDSAFVDVHPIVTQLCILCYLCEVNMCVSFVDVETIDSMDIDTDGEHYTYTFERCGEKFEIRRFDGECMGVFDCKTSFASLQQAKAVIAMMLQDIEKNPGPVYSKPECVQFEERKERKKKQIVRTKTFNWQQKKEQKARAKMMKEARIGKDFVFQMREILPEVAKNVGYAAANMVFPGSGTSLATVIEGSKATALLGALHKSTDDFKECMEKTTQQFPHILDSAQATVSNANLVIQSLGSIVDSIKNQQRLLDSVFGFVTANPLHVLIAVLMAFVAFAYPSLWTGLPLFFFVLNLLEFDVILIKKLRQICGFQGQEMRFQAGEDVNVPLRMAGQVVFTIFAFFGIGMIPTGNFYDSLIRRLDLIPKSVKGAHSIWEKAGEIYEAAEVEFRVYVLGQKREDLVKEEGIHKELHDWVERVDYYYDAINRKQIERDEAAVNEVTQLFQQMSYWLHTRAVRMSLPKEVLQVILSLQPRMNEIFKMVCRSTVHEGGPRVSPLCVMFSGGSKVGKSELLIPLGQLLLAARGYTNENNFFKNNMYNRTAECEYWDGYVGQKICIIDDAFQIKDQVGNPSVEFMESIRLCNTAPCQIHCADLNDKGRFFSSEILLYTTNLTENFHSKIESLNCPEAAVRRLNSNAFRVDVRQGYDTEMRIGFRDCKVIDTRKICYSPDRQAKYDEACKINPRADPRNYYCVHCKDKCKQLKLTDMPFCTHAYKFQKYDMGTDHALSTWLGWSEMLQMLKDYDKSNMKVEKTKLDLYEVIANNPLMFQGNEEFFDSKLLAEESFEDNTLEYDLNNPEHWLLYEELARRRDAYNQVCKRDKADGSLDGFAMYLSRWPELFAFNEQLMSGNVAPKKKMQPTEWHHFWICKLWAEGQDSQIFKTSPLDYDRITQMKERFMESASFDNDESFFEFLSSANQMDVKVEIRDVNAYVKFVQEIRQNGLEDVIVRFLRREEMFVSLPALEIAPIPKESAIQTFKKRFYAHYEWVKKQIQDFFDNFGFMKFVTIVGVIVGMSLAVTGLVQAFGTEEGNKPTRKEDDEKQTFEANADYDHNPKKMNKTRFEAPEYDHAPTRKQQNKFESPDTTKETKLNRMMRPAFEATEQPTEFQGLLDCGAMEVSNRLVCKQMYVLHNDNMVFGNVMFVKGYNLLINKHFIFLIEESVKNGRLRESSGLYLSSVYAAKMIECTVGYLLANARPIEKTLSTGEKIDIDACLVPFNPALTKCNIHGDITKLFATTSDIAKLSGRYKAILPTFNTDMTSKALGLSAGKVPFCTPTIGYKWCASVQGSNDRTVSITTMEDQSTIKFREFWIYDTTTTSGDCGAPLVIQDNSLGRKIVGIHSAGRPGTGMAQCITAEMLRDAIATLPVEYQAYVDLPIVTEEIEEGVEISGSVPLKDGLIVEGLIDPKLRVVGSTDTKIIPSILNGEINGPALTAPTALRPTNGIDPMHKGLVKFGKYVPLIDSKLIDIASNDVKNNMETNMMNLDKTKYARVLTYDEAVLGVEDDEFLAPINRKTSMGFPYTRENKLNGKREAFGVDEWTMDSDLAKRVKADVVTLVDCARKGIQSHVYWTDTLKMERRSLEKVAQGKTRVFCAGPVHFTLAFRQYFLGFAAWLMHNRNANEISPGTNVYSTDWDDIARKILSKAGKNGDGCVAGDFSNFDGSLNGQILWYILDMINEWYDDGEENAVIRRGLWFHIVNAVHINGRVVYRCTHSQPSGCPLTAILNSVYNSIVIRIVFLLCARKANKPNFYSMEKFNQYVAMVAYGDDNLVAILEDIRDWFNQRTITEAFLEIGHEYTDEAKTGKIVEVRNLSECAYLKRKFIFDKVAGRHIAPLALDVILEIPQWTKKGTLRDEILVANVDVCMRELSLHDEEVFNHYRKIIAKKCQHFNVPYRFLTYLEYRTDVLTLPLFEGRADEYQVILHDLDFSCEDEIASHYKEQGRIPKGLVRRMQIRGPHSTGFTKVDHKNALVHICFGEVNRYNVRRLVTCLRRTKDEVSNAILRMNVSRMDDAIVTEVKKQCSWLECDL